MMSSAPENRQSSVQETLVWLHEDSISPRDPALLAFPGSPAVFIWDDAIVEEQAYSLKRVLFQYECLLETPAELLRGDTVESLLWKARQCNAGRIAVTSSVQPRFLHWLRAIQRHLPVEVLPQVEFVPADLRVDLRRFSRFWKRVERYVLGKNAGG